LFFLVKGLLDRLGYLSPPALNDCMMRTLQQQRVGRAAGLAGQVEPPGAICWWMGLALARNLIMILIGTLVWPSAVAERDLSLLSVRPLSTMQRADGEKSIHVNLIPPRACLSNAPIIEMRWRSIVRRQTFSR
jgi:hypothetical protein